MTDYIICSECKKENDLNQTKCVRCGYKLEQAKNPVPLVSPVSSVEENAHNLINETQELVNNSQSENDLTELKNQLEEANVLIEEKTEIIRKFEQNNKLLQKEVANQKDQVLTLKTQLQTASDKLKNLSEAEAKQSIEKLEFIHQIEQIKIEANVKINQLNQTIDEITVERDNLKIQLIHIKQQKQNKSGLATFFAVIFAILTLVAFIILFHTKQELVDTKEELGQLEGEHDKLQKKVKKQCPTLLKMR